VSGGWIRLLDEKLHNLYTSPNILGRPVKNDEMGGTCRTRGREKFVQNLVGKPGGKTPLGRPTRRWEDNIKMDLREIGWEGVELAQDRDRWWAL